MDGGKENKNFQTWRRVANIFKLKDVPKSVDSIKKHINQVIKDMDWVDIEEVHKIWMQKNQKKKKGEAYDMMEIDGRLGTLEELMKQVLVHFPQASVDLVPKDGAVDTITPEMAEDTETEDHVVTFLQEEPGFSLQQDVADYVLPKG